MGSGERTQTLVMEDFSVCQEMAYSAAVHEDEFETEPLLGDEEVQRAERALSGQQAFILDVYDASVQPTLDSLGPDQLAGVTSELTRAYVQNATFRGSDAVVRDKTNRTAALLSLQLEGYTNEEVARLAGASSSEVTTARSMVVRSLRRATPTFGRVVAAVGAVEIANSPSQEQVAQELGAIMLTGRPEGAPCTQVDPEIFFPEHGRSSKAAVRICQACDVRVECLTQALKNHERFGIWGGLTERERRKLQRRAI